MSSGFDIHRLRETGQALRRPAQEMSQILKDAKPKDATDHHQIVSALTGPVQDATAVLELSAQYGVPGVPCDFIPSQDQPPS